MLGILIGLLPIALGIKAFTREGLPLTRSKNLKGAGGKAIGVVCILLGLAFIADGAFSAWRLAKELKSIGAPVSPAAAAKALAPQETSALTWTRHDSPRGGYSVLMPGTPQEEDAPANPLIGKTGGHLTIVEISDDRAYMAQLTTFANAPRDVAKELDSARDSVITSLQGKLTREEEINLGPHPGRELVVALPDSIVMRVRYFLVDHNSYQILATVPLGEESSNETNAFFDSFRLLDE
jgi:hypothetical protein